MDKSLKLLGIIALTEDLPQHNLQKGQVGTIVELLAPNIYEIDFSDNNGQTYTQLPLHTSQLLKLHYNPVKIDRTVTPNPGNITDTTRSSPRKTES